MTTVESRTIKDYTKQFHNILADACPYYLSGRQIQDRFEKDGWKIPQGPRTICRIWVFVESEYGERVSFIPQIFAKDCDFSHLPHGFRCNYDDRPKRRLKEPGLKRSYNKVRAKRKTSSESTEKKKKPRTKAKRDNKQKKSRKHRT